MKKILGVSVQSWILVLIQFTCIIFLLITGPALAKNIFYLSLEVIAIILGIWSVFVMNPDTLNIFPDVRNNASFVTIGPYRYIRHPMYLAVLLFSLSLILDYYYHLRLFIFLLLLASLLFKIEYEENILSNNYPGYKEYCQRTKKLLPYIF